MRVLMLGTPGFAVPTFQALLESRHEVVGLVCQPDRPRGRGQKVAAPPTKTLAEARGIPVLQPLRLKDPGLMAQVAGLSPDIGVVAAYGRILPDALIALPPHGMVNVHASLLPRYRGAAPVQRAVMAGETATGVTIMRVVRELDAGPMLDAVSIPVDAEATSVEIEAELAMQGARLLVRVLDRLAAGERVEEVPQDARLATYAPKIVRADGLIDWTQPATVIHNLVRGLHPWPHAYTYFKDERLLIHRTRVDAAAPAIAGSTPGAVSTAGDELAVATGTGLLNILQVQPEGRRVLTAREWLAGRRDLGDAPRLTPAPGR